MDMTAFKALPPDRQQALEKAVDSKKHLYFIKAKKTVKIGIAYDPSIRIKDLQVGNAYKLELIYVLPFGGAYFEQILAEHFKHLHIRGEWFIYDKTIKDFIKQLKQLSKEVGLKWNLNKNRLQQRD